MDTKEKVNELQNKFSEKEKINELHCQFSLFGRNAKEWARKCLLLLPEIEKYKVWRARGFSCIYEYAAKLAGLSRDQVNESLRILKKIEDKPALISVLEQKGIWAIKPVATIATKESELFWAEKAKSMTVRELEVYVKSVRTLNGRHVAVDNRSGEWIAGAQVITDGVLEKILEEKIEIKIKLSPETLDELNKIKGEGDYETAIIKLIKMRRESLELKKPEPVRTESRHIPNHIRRYIEERDGGICVFPGCNRKYLELHHTDRFFVDNVHDPDRIFCLCAAHHLLAHRGLIESEERGPKFWKIKSRVDEYYAGEYVDKMVSGFRRV